jgi:hypothetical protein
VGCQKNFNKKFSAGDMPPTPVTKKNKIKGSSADPNKNG